MCISFEQLKTTTMDNSNNLICDFGVHKGESYRQVPASFLNWMVGVNHHQAPLARAELRRREQAALASVSSCASKHSELTG